MKTVGEALDKAESALSGVGVEAARTEALFMVADLTGLSSTALHGRRSDRLGADCEERLGEWIERRSGGEPLQYITGVADFRELTLRVTTDVLIPRPETEELVGVALEILSSEFGAGVHGTKTRSVLDLCTGSGCVALSIAREAAAVEVVATDVSGAALGVARENAELNGLAGRVEFAEGDLFDWVKDGSVAAAPGEALETFDLVVANPPYVADSEVPLLQREVRDFEPRLALVAGTDGLDVIRRIIRDAPRFMGVGSVLLMEIGFGQAGAVKVLLEEDRRFTEVRVLKDYSGIERMATAVRTREAGGAEYVQ